MKIENTILRLIVGFFVVAFVTGVADSILKPLLSDVAIGPVSIIIFVGSWWYLNKYLKGDATFSRNKLSKIKTTGKVKIIRETKCTCKACGKVWHYGGAEALNEMGNALQEAGKSMMCCGGCFPAIFIPTHEAKDLTRCPNCGSRSTICKKVEHKVKV